jgi:hypothetical protein
MLRNALSFCCWACLLALLPGCSAVSDVSPAEAGYVSPPQGTPVALIKGMKTDSNSLFGDSHFGFVTLVDLKSVARAADNWNVPLALAPGAHTLGAECRFSNFVARANLQLEVKAGGTYQLMVKVDEAESEDGRRYSDFWIVDRSTGNAVTHVYRRQVMGGRSGSPFRASN